ncbi:NADH-quinone oxidoreductase subunit B family protein [Trichothermofontia sp.]
MDKIKLATIWLGGCSGCHMSFLDLDEWLFDLAAQVDLVFSPIADIKVFPAGVDLCLVEGSIANEDNLELVKQARANTKVLIAFGDCAVTANVPAMRNPLGSAKPVLERCYVEMGDLQAQIPYEPGIVPPLCDRVRPVHEVVPVDAYLPGCPPPADRIRAFLEMALRGEPLHLEGREMLKFG